MMKLYIDLKKSAESKARLVKKPITVHKKDGKTFQRMMLVDPLTGQPVDSKNSKPNPVDRWSTGSEKPTPNDKQVAYPSSTSNKPVGSGSSAVTVRIHKEKLNPVQYKKHEGVDRVSAFVNNDFSDFADIDNIAEVDKAIHKMDSEGNKILANIKPVNPPMSIKYMDTGLSDLEVKKRCGEIGSLDIHKISQGTPLVEAFGEYLEASQDLLDTYKYTKGKGVSALKHIQSIFGNTTKEGMEYVFAGDNPHGITAELEHIDVYGNPKNGYVTCEIGVGFKNKEGNSVANTVRSLYRDKNGQMHVYCNLLVVDPEIQGKGVINTMYERTNQYYKHLSKGHPVDLCLMSNISVGVYAWAKKGYDFATKINLDSARKNLKDFCRYNNLDKDVISKCGYNSIDDLKHSWQFASLDDGKDYALENEFNDDFHGNGVLGKAFMLNGMDHWGGRLLLNAGDDSEKVSERK